jgi:hypothetical protein
MASVTATAPTRQTDRIRRPLPKPARTIRWVSEPIGDDRNYGLCRIRVGKLSADYYVEEFPAADGRGFELQKNPGASPIEEPTTYHVYLHQNGQDRQCDCLGFMQHCHCKHADGLLALLSH